MLISTIAAKLLVTTTLLTLGANSLTASKQLLVPWIAAISNSFSLSLTSKAKGDALWITPSTPLTAESKACGAAMSGTMEKESLEAWLA